MSFTWRAISSGRGEREERGKGEVSNKEEKEREGRGCESRGKGEKRRRGEEVKREKLIYWVKVFHQKSAFNSFCVTS